MNGDFSGVEAGGGEQARGEIVEQAGLFVDERDQFRLARRESWPISPNPVLAARMAVSGVL